jgi:hypothetical protein
MKAVNDLVKKYQIHPILVDIGASGKPPEIWDDLKPYSQYIGFDPDTRDIPDDTSLGYWKSDIINKAVVIGEDASIEIHLTKSPHCSSVLLPEIEDLKQYAWYDLFTVLNKTSVPAISLPTLINQISLERIDWFKTDSQGTDLRLFLSLPERIRDRVLAVDIEPGLMPAYQGEDLFTQAHEYFLNHGFWISDMKIGTCPRIQQDTVNRLFTGNLDKMTFAGDIGESCRYALSGSPYYCEARYLRTIDWLNKHNATERDYITLCIFAIIDNKPGFALDVINAYTQKTNSNDLYHIEQELIADIKREVWIEDKILLVKDIIKRSGLV